MAGDIKGITIEFRGNATPLQKAIRTVDSELKKTTQELTRVNEALKFNPGSVDLWRQKQQLLKDKIDETADKLNALKAAQRQMDAAGVDKSSAEYRKLQREIIETNSQLKTFKSQLNSIGNARLRAVGEQLKQAGSKIESAGQALRGVSAAAGAAVGAVGALTVKSAKWADDLNTLSKRYSIGTQDLQKYGAAAQLVDVDVESIAKTHVRLEKTMLSASKGTGASAEAFDKLGVSVTNSDGSLRDGDAVWQDTIKALGSMTNETERDALAMQLMGKSANELNPLIEDGGKTYEQLANTLAKYNLDFIDQETLDRANQFNDEIDTIKAIGLVAFQSIGTELAGYLAPALEQVVGWVGNLAQWLTSLDPTILTVITGVLGVVAVLAPLLITIGKITTGIGGLISLFGMLSGPVGLVILAIAGLVAAGIALYKNWDKIKATAAGIAASVVAAFNGLRARVAAIWNSIKTAITTPINTAVNLVRSAIAKIKRILSGKLSFPKVKLPHFSISGKFSLNPPSVPKLGVKWYDEGGIFTSPQVIGVGERRPEFVGALDDLRKIVREESGGNVPPININVYASEGMDTRALARQVAFEVEQVLVAKQKQRRAACGY